MKQLDVYWSFRSPYSYLATPDMQRIARDYDVQMNLRVVLPLAVRQPEAIFSGDNGRRARYIMIDSVRRAEFLGMPFHWPRPDPIVQDMKTLTIAAEQPHIYRLCQLGVEAQRQGRGVDYAYEMSSLIFGSGVDWSTRDNMAAAAQRAGLDFDAMAQAIADGDHLDEVERNHAALDAVGQWGVPTFVIDDEPFFGQDRVDTLCWRLDRLGLKR